MLAGESPEHSSPSHCTEDTFVAAERSVVVQASEAYGPNGFLTSTEPYIRPS